MAGDIKNYRDLLVWQKSMDLTVDIYKELKSFPKEELYGLTSQLKRSVISISSNIAEGSARRSTAEFLRFINIARASLAETETQIIAASRLEFMNNKTSEVILTKTAEIGKMLHGLYSSLNIKLKKHELNN